MLNRHHLNWIQEHKGQLKVQMRNGEFKLIVEWLQTNTGERKELIMSTEDPNWFQKVTDVDNNR